MKFNGKSQNGVELARMLLLKKVMFFGHRQVRRSFYWLWWILAILFFLLLFFISAAGSLRAFLPYYLEISGFPFASKNYLVVFQNNHELRPAGGFISAYGIARFRYGLFTGFDIDDVYGEIDRHAYLEPPFPMKTLLANRWYQGYSFRDANYNADFSKTAGELAKMLHLTKPALDLDGVIAVNYSFLEDLLGTLGFLEVEGELYGKDSLFELLESKVNNIDRHNTDELKKRKGILKPFAEALKRKILFSPFKLRKVSDTIVHSLATKEIQLYFKSASLGKFIAEQGWAGSWPSSKQVDFLAVVEANLGGMKSDRYIKRNVTYHVTLKENPQKNLYDLIGDVDIDLYHYGLENIPLSGQYSGFFRVYVPKGSKLLEVAPDYQKDLWQNQEESHDVLGNIVRLKPGQKTRLHYSYILPVGITDGKKYSLYIPKQSGTHQDYYTVIFEAPQSNIITSKDFTPKENFGVFQYEQSADWSLSLNIHPDKSPPFAVYQGINKLGVINITFNKQLAVSSAENSLNYTIKDLNIKHPENTDLLGIDHIEYKDKSILIFVNGMTSQPEERYVLTIKNISDIHGNLINPNPRELTLVQRL